MKLEALEERMLAFERGDGGVLPQGIYPVARLDGRSFTRLTREVLKLKAPFDQRFRDAMAIVMVRLMQSDFRPLLAYSQSDEISLLLDPSESAFDRRERKFLSLLAAEASAVLSRELGVIATMDCRISRLPDPSRVVDYFRWRQGDAERNALNAHCYWRLRSKGMNGREAEAALCGLSIGRKRQFLHELGVRYEDIPHWERFGIACVWEEVSQRGFNPVTGQEERGQRRRPRIELALLEGPAFGTWVRTILTAAKPA